MNLFHKKFVYNDMLALALAGVISLLFAQTAYGWFNTSYKKPEYRSTRAYYIDDSGNATLGSNIDLWEPQNGVELTYQSAARNSKEFCAPQFLRFNFLSKAKKIKVKDSWCVRTHYSNVLPPIRRPYIPIAYCKLVI